jgi:hypothetical protein
MKKLTNILVMALAFFAVSTMSYAEKCETIKTAEIKSSAFTFEQKLQLENLIWEMEGIEDAKYDVNTKTLSVEFNSEKVTTDMMIYSITINLGYSANLVSEKGKNEKSKGNVTKENKVIGLNTDVNLNLFQMIEQQFRAATDKYLNTAIFAK